MIPKPPVWFIAAVAWEICVLILSYILTITGPRDGKLHGATYDESAWS